MGDEQSGAGFVVGIVENKDGGSEYEGVIYSRCLAIRVSDGQLLRIFDPAVLSGDLLIGETYKFILNSTIIRQIQYFPERPASVDSTLWVGRIVSTDWHPPSVEYRAIMGGWLRNRVTNEAPIVLVQTPIGDLIVDDSSLKQPIDVGGFVVWKNVRIDLLAIV